jgi:hypothetical protein
VNLLVFLILLVVGGSILGGIVADLSSASPAASSWPTSARSCS